MLNLDRCLTLIKTNGKTRRPFRVVKFSEIILRLDELGVVFVLVAFNVRRPGLPPRNTETRRRFKIRANLMTFPVTLLNQPLIEV